MFAFVLMKIQIYFVISKHFLYGLNFRHIYNNKKYNKIKRHKKKTLLPVPNIFSTRQFCLSMLVFWFFEKQVRIDIRASIRKWLNSYKIRVKIKSYKKRVKIKFYKIRVNIKFYKIRVKIKSYKIRVKIKSYKIRVKIKSYKMQINIKFYKMLVKLNLTKCK